MPGAIRPWRAPPEAGDPRHALVRGALISETFVFDEFSAFPYQGIMLATLLALSSQCASISSIF